MIKADKTKIYKLDQVVNRIEQNRDKLDCIQDNVENIHLTGIFRLIVLFAILFASMVTCSQVDLIEDRAEPNVKVVEAKSSFSEGIVERIGEQGAVLIGGTVVSFCSKDVALLRVGDKIRYYTANPLGCRAFTILEAVDEPGAFNLEDDWETIYLDTDSLEVEP